MNISLVHFLVGIISKGGAKPNIIPDITELEYSIRAPTKKELDILTGKVQDCFHSAAKQQAAPYD